MKIPILLLTTVLVAGSAEAQAPEKPCADAIPKECATVKFLGEDKGCACFVCHPEVKEKRKVVCTKKEEDKKVLYKLKADAEKAKESSDKAQPEGKADPKSPK